MYFSIFFFKHVKKQRATGRTKDGATFPLSITLKPKYGKDLKKLDRDKHFADDQLFYKGMVWVFANISGLVTFTADGIIHSCNHNFSLMLFGYHENELVGKVQINHNIIDKLKFSFGYQLLKPVLFQFPIVF